MQREEQLSTLSYAVRGRIVGKYLGQVALVLAALNTVPLLFSLFSGDRAVGMRLGASVAALLTFGLPLSRLTVPRGIQVNEAIAITALAFILSPLLSAYAFAAAGIAPLDALFEAISGVTTTGLTTLASVEDKPHAFLFARAWLQWYGGLGIVVLSVALLTGHQVASRRLMDPETASEDLVTNTRTHARRVFIAYGILTAVGMAVALALPISPFAGIAHVLSAVSTGGFSTYDDSLAGFGSSAADMLFALLSFCGAISLPLYYLTYMYGWRQLAEDVELPALLVAVALVSAVLTILFAVGGDPPGEAAFQGLMTGVFAQTTTGFSTVPIAHIGAGAKAAILLAMGVGGCIGSTAGGLKILRFLIVLRLLRLSIQRTAASSHAVVETRLGGRRLADDDIQRALVVVLLFGLTVFFSWLPFVVAGYAPLDALFEVVSATGTVGLSTGIAHSGLPAILKGILCLDMLAGRLEFIAVLVILYPGTWLGKRMEA